MTDLLFYNLYDTCVKYHKYQNQYEYAKEAYIKEIEKFFNHNIFKPIFPSDLLVQKINPVLTFATFEEIPPRLMYRFCDEFGFYAPTVDYLEKDTSIISGSMESYNIFNDWRVYKFTKKVEWK